MTTERVRPFGMGFVLLPGSRGGGTFDSSFVFGGNFVVRYVPNLIKFPQSYGFR